MSLIGFTTTTYKEDRRPAEDAESVGRWILAPAVLAAFLGAAMFGGMAGAAPVFVVTMMLDDPTNGLEMMDASFALSSLLFGGGFVGLMMMFARVLTYDKQPYVSIKETTQEPVREEVKQEPIRGNAAPTYTQPNGSVTIEYGGSKYEFSRSQIRAMMDRLDASNFQVAQNAFSISPGQEYTDVCTIMAGLGYWRVWKRDGKISRVELLDDGAEWLRKVSR